MKLSNLLDQHRKFSNLPSALAEVLGDGYLLQNNSLYKRVRDLAVAKGFQFSSKQNDAYRALPLSQLERILREKTIPYIDNVTVLNEIESRIPGLTVWNDISDSLKGNSVFHESCHAAARTPSLATDIQREVGIDLSEAQTLSLFLEESFANACELLSILDADDVVHRIFIELNSYVYMLEDRVHLRVADDELGSEALMKFILLSYLHANFLHEMSDKDFARTLALAGAPSTLDAKKKKSLRQLSRIAWKLNPRFREVTTRFYLRLNGLKLENSRLLGFDFLRAIETSAAARRFLQKSSICLLAIGFLFCTAVGSVARANNIVAHIEPGKRVQLPESLSCVLPFYRQLQISVWKYQNLSHEDNGCRKCPGH